MSTPGERIKAARFARRPPLRLADLAGDGLSLGMLSKIERGRVSPSLATLQYLAQRLGVPLARLFEGESPGAGAWEALDAARAVLWLGDPVGASERALSLAGGGQALHGPGSEGGPGALMRAAAIGLAAEALLERGNAQGAAGHLMEASAILKSQAPGLPSQGSSRSAPAAGHGLTGAPGAPRPDGATDASGRGMPWDCVALVEAHLAWVLGLLERRRGQTALAERSWSRCLELLEHTGGDGHSFPGWEPRSGGSSTPPGRQPGAVSAVLRARALLELGALHQATGAGHTARNFLVRAGTVLRWLVDPGAVARALLAQADAPAQGLGGPPARESAPVALAAVAIARRLAEQVTHDLARLDRIAFRRPTASPPEVPHSRHLR